ncbi:MAG: pitrilysin family protein [Desulfuromonadaceae bacterium]|nr:pitrilysin family protein [Desulfuromonadaceae bacterium]
MSEYQRTTLDNGLELVVAPLNYLHSVEIICYVKVGSRYESPAQAGLSHFVEHMMFRGNARYSSGPALEQAFEQLGSGINAGTDAESTSYFARVHPDAVAGGLELFSVMLRTPRFLHLEIERAIVIEEALGDFNEVGADVCADNRMARLLWREHPLAQPVIGTPATIRTFGHEEVKNWYRQHYAPDNLVISVAGPVDPDAVQQAVVEYFGSWKARTGPVSCVTAPSHPLSGPEVDWVHDSDSQLTLQLAWRTEGRAHPRAEELRVLRRMLGEGGASFLMQKLREEAGLTYSVEASLEEYADCGCFSIDLSTEPENLLAAVQAVLEVVVKVRSESFKEHLDMVSCNALNYLDFSRDSVEEQAGRYGWGIVSGHMRTLAQDLDFWRNISPAAVQEMAAYCLTSERMGFVCIGPWRESERHAVEEILHHML